MKRRGWWYAGIVVALVAKACYPDRIPERRVRVEADAGKTGTGDGGTGALPGGSGGDATDAGASGNDAGVGGASGEAGSGGAGGEAPSCVLRVDASANVAAPDGDSWESAYSDLRQAADAARARRSSGEPPCELWVAAGEYAAPRRGFDLTDTVLLGGFEGTENARDERAPGLHTTWLRGDGDERAARVVQLDGESTLDGVWISGGELGVAVDGGDVVVRDAWVFDNGPSRGIDVAAGSAHFERVRVFDNHVEDSAGGGGLRLAAQGALTLVDCIFSGNQARKDAGSHPNEGGALLLLGRSAHIARTIFVGNGADGPGGAVSNASRLSVTDSVFVGNGAPTASAMLSVSGAELTNVTVFGNAGGPAIAGEVTLVNSIVWGNPDGSLAAAIGAFAPTVLVSVIEGGHSGRGSQDVITGDPGFVGTRVTATAGSLVGRDTTLVLNHDQSVTAGALRQSFALFEDGRARYVLDNQRTNLTLLGGDTTSFQGLSFEVVSLALEADALAIDRGWGDTEDHPVSDRDVLGRPRRDAAKPDQTSVGTPTYVDLGAYEFQP